MYLDPLVIGSIDLRLELLERLEHLDTVRIQGLKQLLALRRFGVGMLGEMLYNESRVAEEDEVCLGQIAFPDVCVSLRRAR